MDESYEDLKARLDAPPPISWAPRGAEASGLDPDRALESDEIFGTVDEIDERTSEFGSFLMVVLKNADGRFGVAGLGTVLARRFETLKVGDRIGIRYLGKKPSTKGQDYDDYIVTVDRA